MAKLDINGAAFEYVEQGAGEPVVIAYSRRYHWPNRPIAAGADYAMEEHVGDLGAVLRSLHAEPAHLVGHSYGAFVAAACRARAAARAQPSFWPSRR